MRARGMDLRQARPTGVGPSAVLAPGIMAVPQQLSFPPAPSRHNMSQADSRAEPPGTGKRETGEAMHKFLVHNKGDDVGVATEDIRRGEEVTGVYMDTEETITLEARGDIPLSHKIAVHDIPAGGDIIEYHIRIGLAVDTITAGDYVHVHNIRSARWGFDN